MVEPDILRLVHERQIQQGTAPDIARIRSIPIVRVPAPEEVEQVQAYFLLPEAYAAGFRLFKEQVTSLFQVGVYGRLMCMTAVGGGKTGISYGIAAQCARWGLRKTLLLVPPRTVADKVGADLRFWRARLKMPFRVYDLSCPAAKRRELARRDSGLFVMPTTLLQNRTDARTLLEELDADAVVIDEAHWLKNPNSARTKRFDDWLKERAQKGRPVRVFPLTGTPSSKTVMSYHHQMKWSLGSDMPLPLRVGEARMWGDVLDSRTAPTFYQIQPLAGLLLWARDFAPPEEGPFSDDQDGCRRAYYSRLSRVPGVVSSTESACDATLIVRPRMLARPQGEEGARWAAVESYIEMVDKMVTPTGDQIAAPMLKWKWLYELSCGFYLDLVWPDAQEIAQKHSISVAAAEDVLERSRRHNGLLNHYHKALRDWLKENARKELDTPWYVGRDMMRFGAEHVGDELYTIWRIAKDAEHPDLVERRSEVRWVSHYKIQQAVQWALSQQTPRGIIWWDNVEVGSMLRQYFEHYRIPHYFGPSCRKADEDLQDPEKLGDCFLLLSVRGHGTGKNLQFHDRQLFLQWPRSSELVEQSLGRLHRPGQEAEEVLADLQMLTSFEEEHLSCSIIDALYMRLTLGHRWKMHIANFVPRPRVFPPEVLQQRGHDVNMLSASARAMLLEQFPDNYHVPQPS